MDNAGLQALTVELNLEQADQRVKRLVDPKFRGLMQGSEYEAARLFARIRELFKAAEGEERLCGFSNFKEWTADFHRSTKFSTRSISYYLKVGRYLIPRVTEAELTTLESGKR